MQALFKIRTNPTKVSPRMRFPNYLASRQTFDIRSLIRDLLHNPALRQRRPIRHRQIQVRRILRRPKHRHRLRLIRTSRRRHNVLHIRLRIPVVQREPARLHLHHHPVPLQKRVVHPMQTPLVLRHLARLHRLRLRKALPIPSRAKSPQPPSAHTHPPRLRP